MEDDVCANHGLTFDESSACHKGQILSGEITSSKDLDLSLWYSNKAGDFKLKCYFWATLDGNLPVKAGKEIDDATVKKLLNETGNVREISLTADGKSTCGVSPTKIYNVEESWLYHECDDDVCRVSKTIKYRGNDVCKNKFVCT